MRLVDPLQRTLCATLAVCFLLPPPMAWGADPKVSHDGFLPARTAAELDLLGLDRIDVEPTTGTLVFARNDLVVGEGDQRFRVRRAYSPWSGNHTHMGHHWVSSLDQRLDFQPNKRLAVFVDEDGYPHAFTPSGSGFRAIEGRLATITPVGPGWQLTGLGDERVYRFDAEGRLRTRTGAGGTLRYRYDRAGRLQKVQGPWGELTLSRNALGFLTAIVGPGGERIEYGRDLFGNLREVRRGGAYQPYSYDRQGRLTNIAGGLASIRYDGAGRVVGLSGRGLTPTTLSYVVPTDRRGAQTVVARGGMVHRVFVSASGRRIERITPDGTSHVTQLDERNRPVKLVAAGQATWTWTYDERGRLSHATSPDGKTRYRYGSTATDRPTEIHLADGRVVKNQFDLRGNLVAATFPGKGTTRYSYDAQGRVVRLVDARGAVTRLTRNRRGYVIAIDQAGIGTTKIRRDAAGQLLGIKGPDGRITRLSDTSSGRLVRVRDQRGLIWEAEYDRRGQLTRSIDELGMERFYTWDVRGNMLEARDREGLLASFRYDAAGRFAEIKDGAGAAVRYERPDPRTLVVRDDTAGSRTIKYDRLGRVTEELKGQDRIRYAYDQRGKLIRRTTPRGVDRYTYDPQGRMATMTSPDGGYAFGYDAHGRLSKLTNTLLGHTLRYGYNAAGDRTAMHTPWGKQAYTVDTQGRVVGIQTPEGKAIKIDHAQDGRRTAIHYPNGVVTRFLYKRAQLEAVETRRGKKLIDRRAYRYDRRGRVASVTDHRGRTTRYARDFRGRLTRVEAPDETITYQYDKAGNRISERRNGKAVALKLGAGNRLLRRGDHRYRYNAAGALAEDRSTDGVTRYHYDSDDRLIKAESPDGDVIRYGYAPNGTRMWQDGPEGRVDYLHDLADVVGEYRGGKLKTSFVHGSGDDDVLAATRGTRGKSKTYYYHYDLVRSVTSLTDARGKVAARYEYDAFGNTKRAAGTAARWNPFRYTSRQFDAGTQTYHYRARNYDPRQGRFMSADPFGREGGLNLYTYVENDPTLFNDPYGLWPGWLDRAVEKGKNFVKRAAKSVVRVAKKAWNALPEGIKKPLKVGAAFVKGFGKGLWSGAKGIWNMVTDPVGTYNAMKWAVQNWDQVKAALGDKWEEYKDAFYNDPEKFAEMTGIIAGEITIGLVGTKGLDKLAKVGAVAKAARVVTAPVKNVAGRVGSKIAGATAPVRRAAAPLLNQAARVTRPLASGVATAAKPVIWTGKQVLKPLDKTADAIVNTAAWGLRNTVGRAAGAAGRRLRPRGPRVPVAGAGGATPKGSFKPANKRGARGALEGEDARAVVPDEAAPNPANVVDDAAPKRPISMDDPAWDGPLGTNKDKLGDFSGIEGQPIDEIVSRVPEGATRRTLKPQEGKVTEGYEWKWKDDDGVTNRLRVHGPDASAPKGSNAAEGWSARHQRGGKFADNDGTFHPRNVHNENSPHYNPEAGNATHIPIEGNPAAKLPTAARPATPIRAGPSADDFPIGDSVNVPRTGGGTSPGKVLGHTDDGRVHVGFDDGTKTISPEALAAANPAKAFPVGTPVNVPRTGGGTSPGKVLGHTDDGRVHVGFDDGTKTLTPEALRNANPTAPATPVRPAGPLGAAPSKGSLDDLVDDVWKNRDDLAGQGYRPIYRKYNAVQEPNPLAADPSDYLDDVAKMAEGRPANAVSNSQGNPFAPLDEIAKARRAGGANPKVDNTFYRFERADWQPDKITERVYVNASADHAPEIMNRVVKDIVDNPAKYPGVEMAKISGPGAVGNRAENIVIYTQDAAASQRVLEAMQGIQKQNPSWFQNSVPQMTNPVAPGIATGAEPVGFGGMESFGSARAKAISQALERTMREGGDQAAFTRNVAEELRKFGVDPNAPHTNLPGN